MSKYNYTLVVQIWEDASGDKIEEKKLSFDDFIEAWNALKKAQYHAEEWGKIHARE
jgi:pterin-4a-carbinolamine dehydratase